MLGAEALDHFVFTRRLLFSRDTWALGEATLLHGNTPPFYNVTGYEVDGFKPEPIVNFVKGSNSALQEEDFFMGGHTIRDDDTTFISGK